MVSLRWLSLDLAAGLSADCLDFGSLLLDGTVWWTSLAGAQFAVCECKSKFAEQLS